MAVWVWASRGLDGKRANILAQEIADHLQTALEQFSTIAGELRE